MSFGISVYPGLDNTPEENDALIRRAASLGFTRLFTSLHIPEHDKAAFADELRALTGDVGGSAVIRRHEDDLLLFEVAEQELLDADTKQALKEMEK